MSKSFKVDTDRLRAHSKQVDSSSLDVGACTSAVTTAVSPDAFGIICQFLAAPVNQAGPDAIEGIKGLSKALSAAAQGVTGMAVTYETTDLLAQVRITMTGSGGGR